MADAPAFDPAWQDFALELARSLDALDPYEYLILAKPDVNHFVQFAVHEAGAIRAEAVANQFAIEWAGVLTVEDYEGLDRLGWKRPDHRPDGSVNFYIDGLPPVNTAALAVKAVLTLRQIYGVQNVDDLECHSFARDGTQIRFPSLGRRRA